MTFFLRSFVLLGLLLMLGCGGEARGKVSGKVTYNDKPLTGGTVVFNTDDNKLTEHVPIKSDGTYTSDKVPLGNVRIGVIPPPKSPMANMPKGVKMPDLPPGSPQANNYGAAAGEYVDIPQPLRDPATSKLTLTVKSGTQTFDIPLTGPK